MKKKDLELDIIGDSGPFSRLGKSIGYRLHVANAEFLIDCGAPVFQILGPEGLENVEGIIGTHAHEDHKRWFTDIALYQKFSSTTNRQVPLMGSYEILAEYRRSSAAALEETLSGDSTEVVNYAFSDYVNSIRIGPEPKFRCKKISKNDGNFTWRVVDPHDKIVPPNRAKIFQQPEIQKPRMLFKDPENDIWIEPTTFYSYTDERFYDQNTTNIFQHESGLKIKPLKSTAWHGPPTNSLLIEYDGQKIFFSSDTVYNPDLWNKLSSTQTPQKSIDSISDKHFLKDDINKYIEQTWSDQRCQEAKDIYQQNVAMVHDVSGPWATVHSDYNDVKQINNPLLLTHSPDQFTTLEPMAHIGKSYKIRNNKFYEISEQDELFDMNATCYHKKFSEYFVGYEDSSGDHYLIKLQDGQYKVIKTGDSLPDEAEILKQIQLYRELGGDYYPRLTSSNEQYVLRPDGKVEHQKMYSDGSSGEIVQGKRKEIGTKVEGITAES